MISNIADQGTGAIGVINFTLIPKNDVASNGNALQSIVPELT